MLVNFNFCVLFSILFQLILSQVDPGKILNMICQSKCLETFKVMTSDKSIFEGKRKSYLVESFCHSDPKCKGCTTACSDHDNSQEGCKDRCSKVLVDKSSVYECALSCEFIEDRKVNRPGLCPPQLSQSKCVYPCQKDPDCLKQGTKCCQNVVCGSHCQVAKLPTSNVPPAPSAPIVRQMVDKKDRDQINFDLDWSTYDILAMNYPVLFLVQVKMGQLNKEKNDIEGKWRDLISTTKSGVIISSIDPENWYQFRLLAFSKAGYRNPGEITSPITVQYQPTYPTAPKNVTELVSRIAGKHISVTLTWQPGESNTLVPLSNYKLNWRMFHEIHESNPLLPEYEIVIPASDTSYTIQNLSPATTYRIQITSVIIFKDVTYNSTASLYYVTTSTIPKSVPPQLESSQIDTDDECACGSSDKQLPVVVNNSTHVDGQITMLVRLKDGIEFDSTFAPYTFRIRWYPTACIESNLWIPDPHVPDSVQTIVVNNHINHYISGLRMQCRYGIEVDLISQMVKRVIKVWHGCFCTANCNLGSRASQASTSLCPQIDQNLPPSPSNLRVSLQKLKSLSTAHAELQWDCSPSTHVTGFRIIWGPRLEEPIDELMYSKDFLPLLDSEKATSKVVKYPHQTLLLKNLDVHKIYLVKLQAMNAHLSSPESVLFFKVQFDKNAGGLIRSLNSFLLLMFSFSFLSALL